LQLAFKVIDAVAHVQHDHVPKIVDHDMISGNQSAHAVVTQGRIVKTKVVNPVAIDVDQLGRFVARFEVGFEYVAALNGRLGR
jgi:hypothetical protein